MFSLLYSYFWGVAGITLLLMCECLAKGDNLNGVCVLPSISMKCLSSSSAGDSFC